MLGERILSSLKLHWTNKLISNSAKLGYWLWVCHDWFHFYWLRRDERGYLYVIVNSIYMAFIEMRGTQNKPELQNENLLPTIWFNPPIFRSVVGRGTYCALEDLFGRVLKWPIYNTSYAVYGIILRGFNFRWLCNLFKISKNKISKK